MNQTPPTATPIPFRLTPLGRFSRPVASGKRLRPETRERAEKVRAARAVRVAK